MSSSSSVPFRIPVHPAFPPAGLGETPTTPGMALDGAPVPRRILNAAMSPGIRGLYSTYPGEICPSRALQTRNPSGGPRFPTPRSGATELRHRGSVANRQSPITICGGSRATRLVTGACMQHFCSSPRSNGTASALVPAWPRSLESWRRCSVSYPKSNPPVKVSIKCP